MREAQRVVWPGGLIAAGVISRYALLQGHGTVTSLTDRDVSRRLATRLVTGYHPEPDVDPHPGTTDMPAHMLLITTAA